MRQVIARVIEIQELPEPQAGAQRLTVEYSNQDGLLVQGEALYYEQLVPLCERGDRVLLNTTAVDLGLGTGGTSFIIANLTALERGMATGGQGAVIFDDPAPHDGHIMKLRYTPMQRDVLSVEEPTSPHHAALQVASSLEGVPVVCCELHSQVPLVAAAVQAHRPGTTIVYCMTDEAALLASFSALIPQMAAAQLITATITCGQALGGNFEAVNLYSGLLAAKAVCGAEVIICAQGPGIVGTQTRFGHGGLAQTQALHAAAALDGEPLAVLRLSFADRRPRHQGVSHHTLTALGKACLAQATVALPTDSPAALRRIIDEQLTSGGILERHNVVEVDPQSASIDLRGLRVTTMGRGREEDPAFFSASFAAGILAARFATERDKVKPANEGQAHRR